MGLPTDLVALVPVPMFAPMDREALRFSVTPITGRRLILSTRAVGTGRFLRSIFSWPIGLVPVALAQMEVDMRIMLKPGETLTVGFADENDDDGDGVITIEFGAEVLTVCADLPDTTGRQGVIYEERFGDDHDLDGPVQAAPSAYDRKMAISE